MKKKCINCIHFQNCVTFKVKDNKGKIKVMHIIETSYINGFLNEIIQYGNICKYKNLHEWTF